MTVQRKETDRVKRVLMSLYGENYPQAVKNLGIKEKLLGIEEKYRARAEGLERQNQRRIARMALEEGYLRMDDEAVKLLNQGYSLDQILRAIQEAPRGTSLQKRYDELHPQEIFRDVKESKYDDVIPPTRSKDLYDPERIKRRLKLRTGDIYEYPREEEI